MEHRPASRWTRRITVPTRMAAVVAASVLLGAGGALALSGPGVVLAAPTAGETNPDDATQPPTDTSTSEPTEETTDDATAEPTD